MKEIMMALLVWISTQTGYTVNISPPNVYFMTPEEVSDVCIDEGTLVPYVAQSCYKLHKHSIYMRNSFRVENPEAVGVLVHELTHALQLSNGHIYDLSTMNYLEAEAERIEAIYENNKTIQAKIETIPYGSQPGVAVASSGHSINGSDYSSSASPTRSSTPTAPISGSQLSSKSPSAPANLVETTQGGQGDLGYTPVTQPQPVLGPPVQTQPQPVVTHQIRPQGEQQVAQQTQSGQIQVQPGTEAIHTGPTSNYYVPVSEYQAVASAQVALKNELKSARDELNALRLELRDLRREKEDLVLRVENFNSARDELHSLKVEVQDLRKEKESLAARLKDYQGQLDKIKPEAEAREISEKLAREKMAALENELAELKEENRTLNVNLVEYKKKLVKEQPNTTIIPPIAHKDDAQEKPVTNDRLNDVAQYRIYVVQPGDSIWLIAKKNQVKRATVIELNNLDGTLIKPGQKILLPARDSSEEIHATFRRGSFISPKLVR